MKPCAFRHRPTLDLQHSPFSLRAFKTNNPYSTFIATDNEFLNASI